MRRTGVALVALVALSFGLAPDVAAHTVRHESIVKIKLFQGNTVSGIVKSVAACEPGRTVDIYRNGEYETSTMTEADGSWVVTLGPQPPGANRYTVRVLKSELRNDKRHRHICRGDVS